MLDEGGIRTAVNAILIDASLSGGASGSRRCGSTCAADRSLLEDLLRDAWETKAPRRLLG